MQFNSKMNRKNFNSLQEFQADVLFICTIYCENWMLKVSNQANWLLIFKKTQQHSGHFIHATIFSCLILYHMCWASWWAQSVDLSHDEWKPGWVIICFWASQPECNCNSSVKIPNLILTSLSTNQRCFFTYEMTTPCFC